MPRYLAYTVAFDRPGQTGHRNLARMLVSSLLRTRFPGDIVVFHNSPRPLFLVAREGVREVRLANPDGSLSDHDFMTFAHSHKYTAAAQIDPTGYEKVIFIDCDAVVLRGLAGLLRGPWEIAVLSEPGSRIQDGAYGGYLSPAEHKTMKRRGINSGTWAVSAARFHEFLRRWGKIAKRSPNGVAVFREQAAFNRVILDWAGPIREWSRDEVALPFCNRWSAGYRAYTGAAIVHAAGANNLDLKLRFLFSLYAGTYLFDSQLTLLNIMEM